MKLDDILGVSTVVILTAGWITILGYFGFLWSLAYLAFVLTAFVMSLRWAIKHEQRGKIHEA